MLLLTRPFVILWKTYFFLCFLLILLFSFPLYLFLLADPKRYPRAFRLLKRHTRFLCLITGVFLIVNGKENFPRSPYIVVCNHTSYFDILLMYAVVPDYFAFLGKAELESWPLIRIFFTRGMNISVERGSVSGARKAYQKAKDFLANGHSLVIFPEATIPRNVPRMIKFKVGAFKLAIEEQVPIVPITFTRNYKRLMNGGFLKAKAGPGLAPAYVHEPIYTDSLTEKDVLPLLDQCFARIEQTLLKNGD